jgi:hypothetical protein
MHELAVAESISPYNGRTIMKLFLPRSFLTGSLILVLSGSVFSANKFIEITVNRANIRAAATQSASLVVTARHGDVFKLVGESESWYQVQLFSGELRHVHKSLAQEVLYEPEVPEDVSLRRQIFQALNEAEERLIKEANQRFPPDTSLQRNLQHQIQLRDKYKLEVMHRLNSQTPLYRRIFIEGLKKGW